jgi:ArsR family transcriptional regulator
MSIIKPFTNMSHRCIIFNDMNMNAGKAETQVADYLKILGSPFRIQILLSIGYGEACVCHLEAILKKRQAYISQHLMVMRDAGILDTRRDGKYIYYRVVDKNLFKLLKSTAGILNLSSGSLPELAESSKHIHCECPNCQYEP